MSEVHIMDHPLIQHKISYIRREEVGTKEFREVVGEIAGLMCYEATQDLKLRDVKIKTPICEMIGKELTGKKLAVVPILRAGLGMVDGMLSLIPAAKLDISGFIVIRRLLNQWSITASFRRTAMRGRSLSLIRCWQRAAPVQQRFRC